MLLNNCKNVLLSLNVTGLIRVSYFQESLHINWLLLGIFVFINFLIPLNSSVRLIHLNPAKIAPVNIWPDVLPSKKLFLKIKLCCI